MIKLWTICLLLFVAGLNLRAQEKKIDSLDKLIKEAKSDTQRINLKFDKLELLRNGNLDTEIVFARNLIAEAKSVQYNLLEVKTRLELAGAYCFSGDFLQAKNNLDTAKAMMAHISDSSTLAGLYRHYGTMYSMQNKFDTAHKYFDTARVIARVRNDNNQLIDILQGDAIAYQQESNFGQALTNYQEALTVAEKTNDLEDQAYINLNIAITFRSLQEPDRAERSFLKSIELAKLLNFKNVLAYGYANLCGLYFDRREYQMAHDMAMKGAILGEQINDKGIEASSMARAAESLVEMKQFKEAEKLSEQSVRIADSSKQPYNIYQATNTEGFVFWKEQNYSRAAPFFEKALKSLSASDIYDEEVAASYTHLADCYEKTGAFQKALGAFKTGSKIQDSIKGKENIKKATELTLNYEFDKKQQADKAEQQRQKDLTQGRQNALIVGLVLTFLLAVVAFNGFRNKRRANQQLRQQNEKVEKTLSELKATQSQLIQSEKMASLGELTAGIAHEIQNPLNFVNNFSEINQELIDDLKSELKAGNTREAVVLADNISENEKKIAQHGKRADGIVKGMLQHSRTGSGEKELADLNAIAEECLKLSYHNARAKDKAFEVKLETSFDPVIGKFHFVPQDMVRVLVNLFNNAFYAVAEKTKLQPTAYTPTVFVSTRKEGGKIYLTLKDNGVGIPGKIIDKIFQPFFTTKPAGQGTGLGLSLSYDIIKAQGGEIKVNTSEGAFTEFILSLPSN